LGISFFTFQAVSYLVDVYRRGIDPAQKYLDFSCYMTMFSQLVAGPIVRYKDIEHDILHKNTTFDSFYSGMQRFVLGLAKKMLIANQMAEMADTAFGLSPQELATAVAWLGILAYSMQIYFDFSAYSDMAIGLGRMFGFRFPENFQHPYGATSMRDFWRKWHISLSA
jgi:alginate O-acetyltransferase complex protein AlgI